MWTITFSLHGRFLESQFGFTYFDKLIKVIQLIWQTKMKQILMKFSLAHFKQ